MEAIDSCAFGDLRAAGEPIGQHEVPHLPGPNLREEFAFPEGFRQLRMTRLEAPVRSLVGAERALYPRTEEYGSRDHGSA